MTMHLYGLQTEQRHEPLGIDHPGRGCRGSSTATGAAPRRPPTASGPRYGPTTSTTRAARCGTPAGVRPATAC